MAMDIGSASDLVGCKKVTVEGVKELLLFFNMAPREPF